MSKLSDSLADPTAAELEAAERLNRELRDEIKAADKLRQRLERELGILSKIGQRSTPPTWLKSPGKAKGRHTAQPWLMLSDLHLDEVVTPAEVQGMNAYDRAIAKQRLHETARRFVHVVRDYWTGLDYPGVVVAMGGDIFSGDIHEELKETNADTMLGSLDYWIDELAAVFAMFADEFGAVHVPVVVGNHGRTSRKPRAKKRARDNFDWFLGRALQRIFAGDDRVTFDVSESADLLVDSFGHKVMLTHGDQTRGGGGIGGIWPPIMRLEARKQQRQAAVDEPFDLLIMGHWHQLVFGPRFIVNGSLKGIDEYAFQGNFGFEPPQQACWLMTPEHGKTWTAPILSQDRKAEGW